MDKSGRIAGIPYDFRRPTLARIKERLWNPDDPRIFTPHVFGIGWSINFATLKERSRLGFIIAVAITVISLINTVRSTMKFLSSLRRGK